MAHELDRQADGTGTMFSVRETPWHREGVLLAGAPSLDEALRLAAKGHEPAGLCSQPTLSRVDATLATQANRAALGEFLRAAAARRARVRGGRRRSEVTVDLDSVPFEVYGAQPGSVYNGHFGVRCYHPLLASWEWGDFLGAQLRAGNVHTADGGQDFVMPILRWAQAYAVRVWLRMDAGFHSRGHRKPGSIVGDSAVWRAMSAYTHAWRFKHPSPWDYAFFMSRELKQDLGWFWYYWLFTTESVDGSIQNVTTQGTRGIALFRGLRLLQSAQLGRHRDRSFVMIRSSPGVRREIRILSGWLK